MVELEDFKYGGTNISAYRLVDPDLEEVRNVVQDWVIGEMRFGRKIPFQGKTINVRLLDSILYLQIVRCSPNTIYAPDYFK